MFTVGNDIGGTFTDTIFLDERSGRLHIGKTLTTPKDPSLGAVEGIKEILAGLGAKAGEVRSLIHGTTLVVNALIERKGVRTGLITTKGFRDILEARREKRYDLYDIFLEMPEPLVPRYLRKEVTERLSEDGSVVTELDEGEAEKVVQELVAEGVQAIAVCFLHSFRNPRHERRMKSIIKRLAPHLSVSLSVEVIPQIREYERTSTAVANAYTQPLMASYLNEMESRLRQIGFKGNFHVMLSNGGITPLKAAARFPVRVLESGPAAGVIAASYFGQLLGLNKVMSLDMGGTTAKCGLIEDGKPMTTTDFEVARVYRFKQGSGLPIRLPVIDLIEIGAGGGSIASVDEVGLLRVGPQSAGADPGPACYGLGGEEPTVTDADLILGYLNPDFFLGGKMGLDVEAARRALREKICKPLKIEEARAAWGIHQLVDENMANAARVHTVEKGKDPRAFTLMAFGGAGPVHACWVAEKLGIRKVVFPLGSGVTSALGFLVAPFSFDFVRTYMASLDELDLNKLNSILKDMESEGRQLLRSVGVKDKEVSITRFCEMRYVGQGHEINVPVPQGVLSKKDLPAIQRSYDKEYKVLYQRINPGYRVECLTWKVVASSAPPKLKLEKATARKKAELKEALKGQRLAYFPEFKGFCSCPVYDRYRLIPGASFVGPAIIEERESTVVMGSGARAVTDSYLNLIVTLGGRGL